MVLSQSIQVLPTAVVNLIAAGEVIDSLAAVVRELAENSLDAGADRLHIAIWPDAWKVRVADNGHGMSLEALQRAALPHSTSKIHTSDDLWQIQTLGFRGEALHSLAQLATLEICSRSQALPELLQDPLRPNQDQGWYVQYSAEGQPQQRESIAMAQGTVVTVSSLFAGLPNRRSASPSVAQQLKAVQLTIQHLALCHPSVTWQVEQRDRPWFTLYPGCSAQDILPQCLQNVQFHDLYRHQQQLQGSTTTDNAAAQRSQPTTAMIEAVIGLPDRCHRRRPDWLKLAVNRRIVQLPALESTLLNAFRQTLPRDRFPVCFLHFSVSPEQIDWNRHPAKQDIYLQDVGFWQRQVESLVTTMLEFSPVDFSTTNARATQLLKSAEAQGGYNSQRRITTANGWPTTSAGNNQFTDHSLQAGDLAQPNYLKAIAQIHNLYIVAEHAKGIWLVEQHIAHERVLYEQLCDRWQLIALEQPILLSNLQPKQLAQLERLDMLPEPFGQDIWAVRKVPALLAKRSDCSDAVLELSQGGDLQAAQVATACRSAIRNGTPLTLAEMQTLLNQWQQTRNPRTCPHGRPIYLSLEESSLSRFFRRHWVLGKSHGI